MSDLIPFFQEEELTELKGFDLASLEIMYQDRRLVRSLTFAKHRLRRGDICLSAIYCSRYILCNDGDWTLDKFPTM